MTNDVIEVMDEFTLHASAVAVQNGMWAASVVISRNGPGNHRMTHQKKGVVYPNEPEGVRGGLELGRELVLQGKTGL